MGAVDQRHSGIASGINNAVSRTASLIAVAVFGVVMVYTFSTGFQRQITNIPISQDDRSQMSSHTDDLLNIKIPGNADPESAAAIRTAIRVSFVRGFQMTAYLAAALGLLSALSAWLLIGRDERKNRPAVDQ